MRGSRPGYRPLPAPSRRYAGWPFNRPTVSPSTLRRVEKILSFFSWTSFGLGAVAVLWICAEALLVERAPAPEQFLTDLGVVLAPSMVAILVFRIGVMACRRMRAAKGAESRGVLGSLSAFEDTITR